MSYSLKKVIHNIKKNLAVYLIYILEFALGLGIFLSCRSIIASAEKDLEEAETNMSTTEIEIVSELSMSAEGNPGPTPDYDRYKIPVTPETYDNIMEKFKDTLEIRVALYSDTLFAFDNPYDNFGIELVFVNDEFFENVFHTDMNHQTVYFGDNALKAIESAMEKHNENTPWDIYNPKAHAYDTIGFKNGEINLFNHLPINAEAVPQTEQKYIYRYPGRGVQVNEYSISDIAFIPMDYYPEALELQKKCFDEYDNSSEEDRYENRGDYVFLPSIQAVFLPDRYNINILPMLLSELQTPDNAHNFYSNNDALELQKKTQYITGSLARYQKTSLGLLVILVLGNIGIMLIQIHRRRKAIAISCAYGATMGKIAFEILLELLIVTSIGVALAFIGMRFAMPLMQNLYNNTKISLSDMLLTLPIMLITILIPTAAAVRQLKKISISNTLKSI